MAQYAQCPNCTNRENNKDYHTTIYKCRKCGKYSCITWKRKWNFGISPESKGGCASSGHCPHCREYSSRDSVGEVG